MNTPSFNTTTLDAGASSHKVLRNTYALLALSMLPTIAGAWLGVQFHFAGLFAGSPLLGFLAFMGIAYGFMFAIQAKRNSAAGVVLLLAFTFFMGLMLSQMLQWVLRFSNGGHLITLAGGGTAIAFFGLAAVATGIKRDLNSLGSFITIGFFLVMAAVVANIFLHIPALTLFILVAFLAIACCFLVFDINRVVRGGETNYITATLAIYLDVFNIFQNLLALLGIFGGDRD
jgi:modulator of FtsH protease